MMPSPNFQKLVEAEKRKLQEEMFGLKLDGDLALKHAKLVGKFAGLDLAMKLYRDALNQDVIEDRDA